MTKVEKNKADLWKDIQELADMPLNAARADNLVKNLELYDALCRVARAKEDAGELAVAEADTMLCFDCQMAKDWVRGMRNSDGTKGPHWTIEKTMEVQKQYGINCDEITFWAVINSIYSDYCEALKKINASTMEAYAYLAKAWIEDDDTVPNKAAVYYTYVVEH